ncbi:MAG: hypothetical protein ACM3L9_04305 [Deltaproteobacteria bacterium]
MRFLPIALLMLFPADAQSGGSSLSVDELGARHGQALAAAKICPGARTTAKVTELAASLTTGERPAFEAASNKILAAWDKAFACKDVDPAQYPREVNSCRKAKILSCSSTWTEIGPEGSAIPGLLEFAPAD